VVKNNTLLNSELNSETKTNYLHKPGSHLSVVYACAAQASANQALKRNFISPGSKPCSIKQDCQYQWSTWITGPLHSVFLRT